MGQAVLRQVYILYILSLILFTPAYRKRQNLDTTHCRQQQTRVTQLNELAADLSASNTMGLLCHFVWSPPSDCYLVNVVKKSLPIEKAKRERSHI